MVDEFYLIENKVISEAENSMRVYTAGRMTNTYLLHIESHARGAVFVLGYCE